MHERICRGSRHRWRPDLGPRAGSMPCQSCGCSHPGFRVPGTGVLSRVGVPPQLQRLHRGGEVLVRCRWSRCAAIRCMTATHWAAAWHATPSPPRPAPAAVASPLVPAIGVARGPPGPHAAASVRGAHSKPLNGFGPGKFDAEWYRQILCVGGANASGGRPLALVPAKGVCGECAAPCGPTAVRAPRRHSFNAGI